MAAGNVAYSDTRSFSGGLGEKIAAGIRDKIVKSSQLAKKERSFAEAEAEKQGTSLSEAGIGRGFFFKYALGAHFGGDAIARTRGIFAQNPTPGIDPTGNVDSRFRGGFDYNLSFTPVSNANKSVQATQLTDTVKSLGEQGTIVGGAFSKTKATIDKLADEIHVQTSLFDKIHDQEITAQKKKNNKLKARLEESESEIQNALAGNRRPLDTRGIGGGLVNSILSWRNLKTLFNPKIWRRIRNPRRTMRAYRRLGSRYFRRIRGSRLAGQSIRNTRQAGGGLVRNIRNSANIGLRSRTARRMMLRVGGRKLAKLGAKGVSKALVKKVPILGAVAGVAFGIERLMKGDVVGAIGEVASGAASIVPGAGTSLSLAIDAGLMARDAAKEMQPPSPEFAEGGLINIPDSTNEIAKRRMGAKPLDEKFWMSWHKQEHVSSKKARQVEADIISEGLQKYFQGGGLTGFVESMTHSIGSLITGIPGLLWKGIQGAWKWTTEGLGNIWNTVTTAVANGFKWVVESTTKVINKIRETATDIWNASVNWVKGLFGGNDNANTDGAEHGWDVIIPIRLAKEPDKIPDTEGGNTFNAAGADGDRARTETSVKQIKSKLARNGVNVKIVVPEDFSSYEAMDSYISAQSNEGAHIYNMPTVSGQMGRAASKARGEQVNRVTNDIMDQLSDQSGITNTNNAVSMDTSTIQNDLTALAFSTDQNVNSLSFADYEELSSANALAVITGMPNYGNSSSTMPVPIESHISSIATQSDSDILWTTYLRSLE